MTITTTPIDNGVDVDALLGARAAFAETPEIAQFQWRSSVTWENGTHSRSEVESFYGFADEQAHHQSFTLDADHPLQFASQDKGPTPVEYILVGLGGCLTAGVALTEWSWICRCWATAATLSADMDLHGILGADPEVRNGFSGVKVDYQIEADASEDVIRALVAQSQKRSAVFDILTNPTSVAVTVY